MCSSYIPNVGEQPCDLVRYTCSLQHLQDTQLLRVVEGNGKPTR